jgi:nucleotide-binding universal stress UspA family protein
MYERIVVPLDGSGRAEAALTDAVEIARRFDSELVLVRVAHSIQELAAETASEAAPDVGVRIAYERERTEVESAQQYPQEKAAELASEGLRVQTLVEQGDPARAILAAVEQTDASLVVMTTHGRGGLARLFFGSTAEDLIKQSGVAVLVKRVSE